MIFILFILLLLVVAATGVSKLDNATLESFFPLDIDNSDHWDNDTKIFNVTHEWTKKHLHSRMEPEFQIPITLLLTRLNMFPTFPEGSSGEQLRYMDIYSDSLYTLKLTNGHIPYTFAIDTATSLTWIFPITKLDISKPEEFYINLSDVKNNLGITEPDGVIGKVHNGKFSILQSVSPYPSHFDITMVNHQCLVLEGYLPGNDPLIYQHLIKGKLSLSFHEKSFFHSLKEAGVPGIFGLFLSRPESVSQFPKYVSRIDIGNISPDMEYAKFQYFKVNNLDSKHYWKVPINKMWVNEDIVYISMPGVIDTSSENFYGPRDKVDEIYFRVNSALSVTGNSGLYSFSCRKLFTVTIDIGGVQYDIHRDDLIMRATKKSDQCLGRIIASNIAERKFSLGTGFLRNVYTKFDLVESQIGFVSIHTRRGKKQWRNEEIDVKSKEF